MGFASEISAGRAGVSPSRWNCLRASTILYCLTLICFLNTYFYWEDPKLPGRRRNLYESTDLFELLNSALFKALKIVLSAATFFS